MLAYFPRIYPHELLYSVLSRYHRHLGGTNPGGTMEALFGTRFAIAAVDLPGHLDALARRIPPERGLDVHRLIDELTLFPYYAAFALPAARRRAREAMAAGSVANLHLRLGLAAFRARRVTTLRFCPRCRAAMLADYGELYWRRDHQLPSVLVCPEHGSSLLNSTVSVLSCNRHEFIAPTPANCPSSAPALAPEMSAEARVLLHRLAAESARLLEDPGEPRTFRDWTDFYRRRVVEAGLARSPGTMNQKQLHGDFARRLGVMLPYLAAALGPGSFAGDWLVVMVRRHRQAMHPLYHLLLQQFLANGEERTAPFGSGPWSCRNPLAPHYAQNCVTNLTLRRSHCKTVGVFRCACGYVYTRSRDSTATAPGAPRFRSYGPLLDPELRRLVAAHAPLRSIARRLNLDPKTAARLATRLIIQAHRREGRSMPPPARRVPPARRTVAGACTRRQGPARPRRDWAAIDVLWVVRMVRVATAIREADPPVRVTLTELERRIGTRGWIGKRLGRLPQTALQLVRAAETVSEFRERRIRWAIAELERAGQPLRAWRVMRKAGLPPSHLARIQVALDGSGPPGRAAD